MCATSGNIYMRDCLALGGCRASVVVCYSWSLPVPRRLGDCVYIKHAKNHEALEKAL